jgi:predicted acetyltransferase
MEVLIRELGEQDEAAFRAGILELEGEASDWLSFCWEEGMTYAQMLRILTNERAGLELQPGRVAHTMFYGFLGEKIIGRVSVRHELNEPLRQRGGHLGYWVARRFRNQGYATQMVGQALAFCRERLGLRSVLITCADDNVASMKIIERFGGQLEDRVWDEVDGETIRRYWVPIG